MSDAFQHTNEKIPVCHLAQSTVADLIEAEGCEYNGRRKGVIFEQVETTV